MDFSSRNGVVWGRRWPQLEFSLDCTFVVERQIEHGFGVGLLFGETDAFA